MISISEGETRGEYHEAKGCGLPELPGYQVEPGRRHQQQRCSLSPVKSAPRLTNQVPADCEPQENKGISEDRPTFGYDSRPLGLAEKKRSRPGQESRSGIRPDSQPTAKQRRLDRRVDRLSKIAKISYNNPIFHSSTGTEPLFVHF